MTNVHWTSTDFDADQQRVLSMYFTSTDLPVFAIKQLPPVVAGALFARYSRSASGIRQLFLDEFSSQAVSSLHEDVEAGGERARQLYQRMLGEYGDDSVAQLGSAHLCCEQVSNLLTKVLERPRLGAYLEQSTRYVDYGSRRPDGTWRYWYDATRSDHPVVRVYRKSMDAQFEDYKWLLASMRVALASQYPDSPAGRAACRAAALDAVRGVLPAATLSNMGIYANGQVYEGLLVRTGVSRLPEARDWAAMALPQLRLVIPDFLTRVDRPDRGLVQASYISDRRQAVADIVASLGVGRHADVVDCSSRVALTEWDPQAEVRLVAAIAYPHSGLSEVELDRWAAGLSDAERGLVIEASVGVREDRRYRPGRAWERPAYRFDIVADYGVFRDLQRHRICEIEWQPLDCSLGFDVPDAIEEPEIIERYMAAMARSADLYRFLGGSELSDQAPYATALGYKCRFKMGLNAREAMHILELRSTPQGHPSYRKIVQSMHRQIGEVAGHRAIAGAMQHVNHSVSTQGRLAAEERAAARLSAVGTGSVVPGVV